MFEIRKNLDLRKILVTPKNFLKSRFVCILFCSKFGYLSGYFGFESERKSSYINQLCIKLGLAPFFAITGPQFGIGNAAQESENIFALSFTVV